MGDPKYGETETLLKEEQERLEYNSQIPANYQNLMTMSGAELRKEENLPERKYSTIDSYKPYYSNQYYGDKEITFEDVQIPDGMQWGAKQAEEPKKAQAYSPALDFQNSIYADPYYRKAAGELSSRRQLIQPEPEYPEAQPAPGPEQAYAQAQAAQAPGMYQRQAYYDESLAFPTATTLQYGQAAARPHAAEDTRTRAVVRSAEEDEQLYYAALAKKLIVFFSVVFVALLVVIGINTAVINGMDIEIAALEETLAALQQEVADLQEAIADATSWETILEFIESHGMVYGG